MTAPIVKELLCYATRGTLIDIGAGRGRNAIFLAEHGFDVTALDADPEKVAMIIEQASLQNLQIKAVASDIRDFRFPRNFEIILSTMLLHFLPERDLDYEMKRMKQYSAAEAVHAVTVLTDKNIGINREHLFRPGELLDRYQGWDVLSYSEGLGEPFLSKQHNTIIRQHRAALIARRPRN